MCVLRFLWAPANPSRGATYHHRGSHFCFAQCDTFSPPPTCTCVKIFSSCSKCLSPKYTVRKWVEITSCLLKTIFCWRETKITSSYNPPEPSVVGEEKKRMSHGTVPTDNSMVINKSVYTCFGAARSPCPARSMEAVSIPSVTDLPDNTQKTDCAWSPATGSGI